MWSRTSTLTRSITDNASNLLISRNKTLQAQQVQNTWKYSYLGKIFLSPRTEFHLITQKREILTYWNIYIHHLGSLTNILLHKHDTITVSSKLEAKGKITTKEELKGKKILFSECFPEPYSTSNFHRCGRKKGQIYQASSSWSPPNFNFKWGCISSTSSCLLSLPLVALLKSLKQFQLLRQ